MRERPSYKAGLARNAAESAYPNLWRGLVGAWKPSLGQTQDLQDLSGEGKNAVPTNMAAPPTSTSGWWLSDVGHVLMYDGSNDYSLISPISDKIDADDIGSIVVWVKRTALNNWDYVLVSKPSSGANDGDNTRQLVLRVRGDTNVLSIWTALAGTTLLGNATTVVSAGEWHMLAYTTGLGGNALYLDGKKESVSYSTGSAATSSFFGNTTGSAKKIGIGVTWGTSSTREFTGAIDDLYIWDRELTPNEVATLFAVKSALFIKKRRVVGYAAAGGATFNEAPFDTISMSDSLVLSVAKEVADTITIADTTAKLVTKILADTLSLSDAPVKSAQMAIADAVSIADAVAKSIASIVSDAASIADTAQISASLVVADAASIADSVSKGVQAAIADSVSISEATAIALAHIEADGIAITDSVVSGISGQVTEAVSDIIVISDSVVSVKISGVPNKDRKEPITRETETVEWQEIIDIERDI